MSISKKGKRKITVSARDYLWYHYDDYDQTTFWGHQVRIIAADQQFSIHYGLEQQPGKRFAALALRNNNMLVHLTCPKFENERGIITSGGIAALIRWCTEPVNGDEERRVIYALDGGRNDGDEVEREDVYEKISAGIRG